MHRTHLLSDESRQLPTNHPERVRFEVTIGEAFFEANHQTN